MRVIERFSGLEFIPISPGRHDRHVGRIILSDASSLLLPDARQSLVHADRCVLKLPRFLPWWRRALPHELPRESLRKRLCDDVRGLVSELRVEFGGFREWKAIQLGVDLESIP